MSKTENNLNNKIEKLDSEIEWFYGEDFSLDQAAEKYKTSLALAQEIENDLENLKNEIELIDQDFTKA